jgi:hypothetical protein
VVAYPAAHVERPHAVCPHVAERHWLNWFAEASGRHAANVARPVAVGEGYRRTFEDLLQELCREGRVAPTHPAPRNE